LGVVGWIGWVELLGIYWWLERICMGLSTMGFFVVVVCKVFVVVVVLVVGCVVVFLVGDVVVVGGEVAGVQRGYFVGCVEIFGGCKIYFECCGSGGFIVIFVLGYGNVVDIWGEKVWIEY